MNGCSHARLPLVRDACRDDATVLALSVVRSIAAGYMTGDVACWDTGFEGAERILGEVEGPRFVAAMAGLMRAIRRERQGDFSFLPATCCRVTADEQDLLDLLWTGHTRLAPACALFARRDKAPRLQRGIREAQAALAVAGLLLGRPVAAPPARPASPLH